MTNETPGEVRRGGLRVIGAVLVVSTALAIFAAYRFRTSETYLTQMHEEFAERGRELTVGGCAEAVLEWRTECEAMKSLCDSNVERMMDACLRAQDRTDWCTEYGTALGDSHFASAACQAHGIDRKNREDWKFCGMAYRATDLYCRTASSPDN